MKKNEKSHTYIARDETITRYILVNAYVGKKRENYQVIKMIKFHSVSEWK